MIITHRIEFKEIFEQISLQFKHIVKVQFVDVMCTLIVIALQRNDFKIGPNYIILMPYYFRVLATKIMIPIIDQ